MHKSSCFHTNHIYINIYFISTQSSSQNVAVCPWIDYWTQCFVNTQRFDTRFCGQTKFCAGLCGNRTIKFIAANFIKWKRKRFNVNPGRRLKAVKENFIEFLCERRIMSFEMVWSFHWLPPRLTLQILISLSSLLMIKSNWIKGNCCHFIPIRLNTDLNFRCRKSIRKRNPI